MAAAVVVLIAGIWVGIRQKSIDQVNRDEAAETCAAEYPRFLEWERSGNSLANWWNDSIPNDPGGKRATKKEFVERCIAMTVD